MGVENCSVAPVWWGFALGLGEDCMREGPQQRGFLNHEGCFLTKGQLWTSFYLACFWIKVIKVRPDY